MKPLQINGRIHLIPEKGYRLTEGDGVYPLEVILEVGEDSSKYYEVPESEYEKILAEQENELLNDDEYDDEYDDEESSIE